MSSKLGELRFNVIVQISHKDAPRS
jgi:hypothetical protein